MYSPPDRANVEREHRAKLEGIQINSFIGLGGLRSAFFYKCDLRITSYEPRTSLTSLFLQVQIFLNAKLAPLAQHVFFFLFFYGLTLACKRSHLVTFSAVYGTTNEYPEMVFVCKIEAAAASWWWSFYNVGGFKRRQQQK